MMGIDTAFSALAPSNVLELQNISKTYGSEIFAVPVLHEVNLTIRRGELVGIVGPSGSGKSTLLNIMGTLDKPTTGSVRLAGYATKDLGDDSLAALRSRTLGFVFQQFFLLDGRSALDNVADGLLYSGVPRAQRNQRAAMVLDQVGLSHRLNHLPSQLSGGECQRVAIARALINEPEMILADEPTGNLDSASSAEIEALLNILHHAGATIVVITHDQELAARFPRVVSVKDGHISHDTNLESKA